jgi:CRISPR-associated protein Csx16
MVMAAYFVTRHAGAIDWARRAGIDATLINHLDPAILRPGDTVLGTLPVSLAAQVCAQGARYLHLTLDIPAEHRGRELTAADMNAFGARLEEFEVRRVDHVAS